LADIRGEELAGRAGPDEADPAHRCLLDGEGHGRATHQTAGRLGSAVDDCRSRPLVADVDFRCQVETAGACLGDEAGDLDQPARVVALDRLVEVRAEQERRIVGARSGRLVRGDPNPFELRNLDDHERLGRIPPLAGRAATVDGLGC